MATQRKTSSAATARGEDISPWVWWCIIAALLLVMLLRMRINRLERELDSYLERQTSLDNFRQMQEAERKRMRAEFREDVATAVAQGVSQAHALTKD